MNPRSEQVMAVSLELAVARQKVEELEARLDHLLGGGEARPRKERPVGKVAVAPVASEQGSHSRQPDPIREQIVALAKKGLGRNAIAEELGLKGRAGLVRVGNHLYRARQAGTLPKAEASR